MYRFQLVPSFAWSKTFGSLRGCYAEIDTLRQEYAAGLSHIHEVRVQVREAGDWKRLETVTFPGSPDGKATP